MPKTDLPFQDVEVTSENERAIRSIRTRWSPIVNSSVVSVHYAFTTTEFSDTSLIVVSDYHPASIAVADKPSVNALPRPARQIALQQTPDPVEAIVMNYIVQIANGLKAIHSAGLAARSIDIRKVLVTDENRIRLNGCATEELFDQQPSSLDGMQRQDFVDLGKFLQDVGKKHTGQPNSRSKFSDPFLKLSEHARSVIKWLLDHDREDNNQGIDVLLALISPNIADALDGSLRLDDELQINLSRELENSRIVRLMTKLNCLIERPEHKHDRSYSSQGSRTDIALFRDYVFHQVDAQGNPVVNMGHILTCLNKLDVGVEEKIQLSTRDELTIIIVSYREVKTEIEKAWQDLMRRSAN